MTFTSDLTGAEAANSAADVKQSVARLLVIDDDAVHRAIICKLAAKVGFDAVEARNCGDVVRLTAIGDFGCVTLDLSLGERAGTEVLLHFSLCRFRAPILIVSGADSALTRSAFEFGQSRDLDMLEPVGKPIRSTELRERLTVVAEDLRSKRRANAPA